MASLVLKGKPVAEKIKMELLNKFAGRQWTFATLLVGENPEAKVYRNRLTKLAESIGLSVRNIELKATASQKEIEIELNKLNEDSKVKGILPFMPLPTPLDGKHLCSLLAPSKDVDCLSPYNAGGFYLGEHCLAPCTARSCLEILKFYNIPMAGKKVVVIGRSNVIGKPVALLLLKENATVTICHSKTKNLTEILRETDIIIAAMGKAEFVKENMVKQGAVLVDVGINVCDGKILGDLSMDATNKAYAYTPVPGGVGVVSNILIMSTIAQLNNL